MSPLCVILFEDKKVKGLTNITQAGALIL